MNDCLFVSTKCFFVSTVLLISKTVITCYAVDFIRLKLNKVNNMQYIISAYRNSCNGTFPAKRLHNFSTKD